MGGIGRIKVDECLLEEGGRNIRAEMAGIRDTELEALKAVRGDLASMESTFAGRLTACMDAAIGKDIPRLMSHMEHFAKSADDTNAFLKSVDDAAARAFMQEQSMAAEAGDPQYADYMKSRLADGK